MEVCWHFATKTIAFNPAKKKEWRGSNHDWRGGTVATGLVKGAGAPATGVF